MSEFTAGEVTCRSKKKFHSVSMNLVTQESVLDVFLNGGGEASYTSWYIQHVWGRKKSSCGHVAKDGLQMWSSNGRIMGDV